MGGTDLSTRGRARMNLPQEVSDALPPRTPVWRRPAHLISSPEGKIASLRRVDSCSLQVRKGPSGVDSNWACTIAAAQIELLDVLFSVWIRCQSLTVGTHSLCASRSAQSSETEGVDVVSCTPGMLELPGRRQTRESQVGLFAADEKTRGGEEQEHTWMSVSDAATSSSRHMGQDLSSTEILTLL